MMTRVTFFSYNATTFTNYHSNLCETNYSFLYIIPSQGYYKVMPGSMHFKSVMNK